MSDPKTFDLKHPFTYQGQTFNSFSARDPKVRDLKKFVKDSQKDSIQAMQNVLTVLCEVGDGVMEEVHIKDFSLMRKWFEDFFSDDETA